jgi:hypothetical protein
MHPGSGSTLSTGDGRRRVRLGKLIKSGGAGSVYRLADDATSVAKIYHADQDLPLYERKVAAMLALTPQLPDIADGGKQYVQIAWPQALLRDDRGGFVGWLMPAVHVDETSELEYILQERQALQHGLPTGLGARITLAANLAAVIAELHRQRHHVVDMKPVNLRFYPKSLYMAMLDCDGFSIQGRGERFVATQVTPDYLAPEFQRGGLTAAGEETQDRFALATIVFQLLNFGLHPYSGRPANDRVATDIPGRIGQRAYPYGRRTNPAIAPNPASGHLAIAADLRVLFDRAFESSGSGRPAAAEWATALRTQAQRSAGKLVACTRDPAHQHFVGLPCAACARAALIAGTAQRAGEARNAAAARVARALPSSLPIGGGRRPAASPSTPSIVVQRRPPPPLGGARVPARPRPPPPRPMPLPSTYRAPTGPGGLLGALTKRHYRFGQTVTWAHAVVFAALLIFALVNRMERPAFLGGTSAVEVSDAEYAARKARAEEERRRMRDEMQQQARARQAAARDGWQAGRPWLEAKIDDAITEVLAGERLLMPSPPGPRPPRGSADDLSGLVPILALDPAGRQAAVAAFRQGTGGAGDPHALADFGWLQLLAGDAAGARATFVDAIGAAPDRPSAWHGLALTAGTDRERVGLRTIAEIVASERGNAAAVRAQVSAAQADLAVDAQRWLLIDARARMLAAHTLGETLPSGLRELATKPLPP